MFGEYSISANPGVSERYKYLTGSLLIYLKENYKITSFVPDDMGIDVRILDPVCRNPAEPNRASDHLLRWHFRVFLQT